MENRCCSNNCCVIKIKQYKVNLSHPYSRPKFRKKAGVFIYDPKNKKVLLVQSRGQLWGPPKGTVEYNEGIKECAIREVREETGLSIKGENFLRAVKIKNRAVYYYMELNEVEVNVQEDEFNDANGITWIKIDCLEREINSGKMFLNKHCKILFNKFLKKNFI